MIEDKNNDMDNLIIIFEFLFNKYTIAYPVFSMQEVNTGEDFDTDQHIRHSSSSSVSGIVSQVLFKGWINTKTSNIIKKSVVKI